jgi:hypothetical protein
VQVKKEFVWRRWFNSHQVTDHAALAEWRAGFGTSEVGLRQWLGLAFHQLLHIDPAADPVVLLEVALLPPSDPGEFKLYFRVGSLEQAELLVRRRCALRGGGDLLMEVLTPVEREYRRRLWPAFEAAQEAGKRAQFVRSRLYVDGRELASPSS